MKSLKRVRETIINQTDASGIFFGLQGDFESMKPSTDFETVEKQVVDAVVNGGAYLAKMLQTNELILAIDSFLEERPNKMMRFEFPTSISHGCKNCKTNGLITCDNLCKNCISSDIEESPIDQQEKLQRHPAILDNKELADIAKQLQQQKELLQSQLETSLAEVEILKRTTKWFSFEKITSAISIWNQPLIDGHGHLIECNDMFVELIGLTRETLENNFTYETINAFLKASKHKVEIQEPGDGTVVITINIEK